MTKIDKALSLLVDARLRGTTIYREWQFGPDVARFNLILLSGPERDILVASFAPRLLTSKHKKEGQCSLAEAMEMVKAYPFMSEEQVIHDQAGPSVHNRRIWES